MGSVGTDAPPKFSEQGCPPPRLSAVFANGDITLQLLRTGQSLGQFDALY